MRGTNDELDVRLLRALTALVEEKSVSRAAARVRCSQPAMSRTLARLRELLGDDVLVRSARGMAPTARALEVAAGVREGLARLDQALDPPNFDPASSTRRFVMMSWDYTERVLLPSLLAALGALAPRASLEARVIADRAPTDALERGEVDLVVGLHRNLSRGFYRKALFEDRFVCVRRRERSAKKLDLDTYAALPHLLVAPFGAAPGIVDLALAKVGLARHIAAVVPHFLLAPELVAESGLCATIPARLAESASRRLALRIDEPPVPLPRFTVEAVWHERAQRDLGHRWFRQLVLETARRIPRGTSRSSG